MHVHGNIVHGIEVSKTVKYACVQCHKEQRLEFNHVMMQKTKRLFNEALDKQLCMSCLLSEPDRVAGAAENLEGLLAQ